MSRRRTTDANGEPCAQMKNHVGMVVDRFWALIPADHTAHRINLMDMPFRADQLLYLGREVARVCEEEGHPFEIKLLHEVDVDAWSRLIGAWVCYCRDRIAKDGSLPPRSQLAVDLGLGASSLTNFLNARRPVTMPALKALGPHMGFIPLDIRPEMGASQVYSQDRKVKKSMALIRNKLEDVIAEIKLMHGGIPANEIDGLIRKIEAAKTAAVA